MAAPHPYTQGMAARVAPCYRHSRRAATVRCQRCERPICTECMVSAAVGFQCPDCVRAGLRRTRQWAAMRRSRLIVTPALIGINVLVWFIVAAATGEVSLWGGGVTSIHRDFALEGSLVDSGEYWRLVTSGFLHYGLLHLGMNMLVLWWLGRMLETGAGWARLLLLYAVSLLGGSLGALALDPNAFTAGASGAVFGLGGAVVVAERASRFSRQDSGVLGFLLINIVISLTIPGISLGGHIGGLLLRGLAAAALWGFRNWPAYARAARAAFPLRALPEAVVIALGAGAVWLTLSVVAPRWQTPLF